MLAVDPSVDTAALRPLRRSAAHVAIHQRAARPLSAVPALAAARRSRARDWRVRRRAARDHPRAQVRRPSIAGTAAGGDDAGPWRRYAQRRRVRRSGAAASVAAPASRLQSGRGSRGASATATDRRAGAHARDADADGPPGRAAARQRARRVLHHSRRPAARGSGCRARRRCEYDGRDAGSVRAGTEAGGRERSARAYGRASRDATALKTSAAISSFDRSPSITIHRPAAACRR